MNRNQKEERMHFHRAASPRTAELADEAIELCKLARTHGHLRRSGMQPGAFKVAASRVRLTSKHASRPSAQPTTGGRPT